jgi:uncharacterized protein
MFVSSGWLRASKRELEADTSALRPRPTFRAEDAAPLEDGWNEVRVEVFPFGHAFREGSRIRLTVEAPGGNRPLWRFDSVVEGGPDVENRVAHSIAHPSKLVLPIVDVEVDVTSDLPGCESSTDGGGFTAVRGQPCRTAPDLGGPVDPAPTGAVVRGSVNQVEVTDADPDTPITLLDPAGEPVAQDAFPWEVGGTSFVVGGDRTDPVGSIIFRGTLDDTLGYSGIPAGAGYTVEYVEDGQTRVSDPVTVLGPDDTPDQALYDGQTLGTGLTYLETRDGTLLSTYVSLPNPSIYGPGPYPTLIEYSGYDVTAPPQPGGLPINIQAPTLALGQLLGYATVAVNIRGSGCSGGAFDYFELLQSLDGYDAVEAVAAQPWSANVGMVGVSYPGIAQLFAGSTQPPNLAAMVPVSFISDPARDTIYPGGMFNTGFAFEWAEERELDTRYPGGQGWVDRITQEEGPAADQCRQNVKLRQQNLPLLDRVLANTDRNPLWDTRSPYAFGEDLTTNMLLVNSWQDEQTGGRAAALLDALELDGDNTVRFIGTNGTHTELFGPSILASMIEFLELYVAERTPQLRTRSDWTQIRFILPTLYAEVYGPGIPSNIGDLVPADRFTGLSYEDALAAYESEPPAQILFEVGAGDGPDGFPFPRFDHRFEWSELPNLDDTFDADAAAFFLTEDGLDPAGPGLRTAPRPRTPTTRTRRSGPTASPRGPGTARSGASSRTTSGSTRRRTVTRRSCRSRWPRTRSWSGRRRSTCGSAPTTPNVTPTSRSCSPRSVPTGPRCT